MGVQYRLGILARSLRNLKQPAEANLQFGILQARDPEKRADTKADLVFVATNGSKKRPRAVVGGMVTTLLAILFIIPLVARSVGTG